MNIVDGGRWTRNRGVGTGRDYHDNAIKDSRGVAAERSVCRAAEAIGDVNVSGASGACQAAKEGVSPLTLWHGLVRSQVARLVFSALIVIVLAPDKFAFAQKSTPETSPSRQNHPGFSAPNRFDTTPIKLRIGSARYAIPANYFDAPLEVKGKDGEYSIVIGFLILGLLPEFDGKTPGNWREIATTLGWGQKINFLINLPGLPPAEGLRRMQDTVLGLRWRERAATASGPDNIITMELNNHGYGSDKQDAFVDILTGHYTICQRRQPPSVLSPSCRHFGENGNIFYKITYGREHYEHHKSVVSTVLAKLKSWELNP